MSGLVIGIEVEREERLSVTLKASVAAIHEIAFGALGRQRQPIEAAGEDRLDGAVRGRGMRERPHTRRFESRTTVGIGEMQSVLRTAQALENPVAQQLIDQRSAARTDIRRLGQAPVPVMGEEGTLLGGK